MKKKRENVNRRVVELVLMLFWGLWLQGSASSYVPYLLVFTGGIVCFFRGKEPEASSRERKTVEVFSWILSCCVVLGNSSRILWPWPQMLPLSVSRILTAGMLLVGGAGLFRRILLELVAGTGRAYSGEPSKKKDLYWLFGPWMVLAGAYWLVMYLGFYPGVLSVDSIRQMTEVMGLAPVTNQNPFYHTQLIGLLFRFGKAITGTVQGGVACFSQFSILVMSGCFSYVVFTLYQLYRKKGAALLLMGWYLAMPAHIMFSFTMWKDVLFSGAVLVFSVSMFRLEMRMGKGNLPVVLLSAFMMCLMRVNGSGNLALVLAGACFLYRKESKRLLVALGAVLVGGYILVFPLLSILGIQQSDGAEALSVPIQQIGFVVTNNCPLTQEETALLEEIVDLEKVPESYMNFISDPLKALLREKGNLSYLEAHRGEYLKLYLSLGLRYPVEYLQAWVEQTKGYYDGGYDYDRWNNKVDYNTLGITMEPKSMGVNGLVNRYLELWETSPITRIALCLGFHFWLVLGCMCLAIAKKNRALMLCCLPFVSVVALLVIGTPVFAEFRYAYPLICGVPFLVSIAVLGMNSGNNSEMTGDISPFPIAKTEKQ